MSSKRALRRKLQRHALARLRERFGLDNIDDANNIASQIKAGLAQQLAPNSSKYRLWYKGKELIVVWSKGTGIRTILFPYGSPEQRQQWQEHKQSL